MSAEPESRPVDNGAEDPKDAGGDRESKKDDRYNPRQDACGDWQGPSEGIVCVSCVPCLQTSSDLRLKWLLRFLQAQSLALALALSRRRRRRQEEPLSLPQPWWWRWWWWRRQKPLSQRWQEEPFSLAQSRAWWWKKAL